MSSITKFTTTAQIHESSICSNLMCLSVGTLFPNAHHFGILRSSGTRGAHIFEELIDVDKIPLFMEIKRRALTSESCEENTSKNDAKNKLRGESDTNFNACALLGDPHNIPVQFLRSERSERFNKALVNDGPHLVVVVSYAPMEQRGLCFNTVIGPTAFNAVQYRCAWSVTAVGNDLTDNGEPSGMYDGPHCIELNGFENVETVRNGFISECENLKQINLAPLVEVTTIGDDCLFWCISLKSIDLTPFSKVSRIGDNFMSGCSTLTSVDLTPFSRVVSIGEAFLAGCQELRTIIVSCSTFLNMEEIADCFADDCPLLSAFDTSSFVNVKVVGCSFLCKCISIKSVDITPFRHITECGVDFINHCSYFADAVSTVPLHELSTALRKAIEDSSISLTISTLVNE